MVSRRSPMKRAPHRSWYADDRVAWVVYALGVIAMFGVIWVSVAFQDGDLSAQRERPLLFMKLFFAAAAFALSGPATVTFAQLIIGRVVFSTKKKQKVADFDEL